MIPDHYLRTDKITELIPVLSYDEESSLFLLEDQALAFGFISAPLPGADAAAGDRLQILLSQNWPKGSMVQVLSTSLSDVTRLVASYRHEREVAVQKLRQGRSQKGKVSAEKERELQAQEQTILNLTERQARFWQEGAAKPILERDKLKVMDSNVIFTMRYPIAGARPTDEEERRAVRAREQFEATMKSVGLAPIAMNASMWIRIMNAILCQSPNSDWRANPNTRWDRKKTLDEQAIDPGLTIEVQRNRIELSHDRVIKFLCVKQLPDYVYFGMAREYHCDIKTGSRGLKENSVIFTTIYYDDHESERTKAATERTWVTHQAFGPMLKFSPGLAQQKHSYDALGEALDDGDRVVRVYFGVMLICDKAEESYAVANAISFMRERHFHMMEDAHIMIPALCTALPLCADPKTIKPLNRYRRMAGRHATAILPIMGDWKGSHEPAMTFIARSGQMMFMSPFDSPASYNSLTIGGSGGGKSFLNNFYCTSLLSMGGRVWVIDIGKSYANLCANLGGQFIEFGRDSTFCLNPFELVQDYKEEADILLGIVLSMAFLAGGPDDYQTSGCRRVLNDLWNKHGNQLMIDHVADALMHDGDPRLRDIGAQLFAFTSAGDFGRYFNGKNTVDLNNRFVVIELEELKSRPHLQKVILLQLIYQIQQECYLGDRDQRKALLVDEGWQLIGGSATTDGKPDPVLTFLEGAFRRFRKYGASVNIITQGLEELYATPNGKAMVSNSPNMYFLRQKTEVVERAKDEKRLGMSDGGYELLKTIHTAPGEYSEVFFLTEYGIGIGRLIVDPYTRIMYSTLPKDVQRIRDLTAQGLTVDQAIRSMLGEPIHEDDERKAA